MKAHWLLSVLSAVLAAGADRVAADPAFSAASASNGAVNAVLDLPPGATRVTVETRGDLTSDPWASRLVGRPPPDSTQTWFSLAAPAQALQFARAVVQTNHDPAAMRVRALYNGHILTVDPVAALSPAGTNERHRLYVLNAVLVDPQSGRVAAVYPPFASDAGGTNVARPLESWPELATNETPPPPATMTPADLRAAWLGQGVSTTVLDGADFIDLQGAVATPGLMDGHFHVTSWSKKIPEPGRTYGYYPDVSDARFVVDTNSGSRRGPAACLAAIVADVNENLVRGSTGVFLHGFAYTTLTDSPSDPRGYPYAFAATQTLNSAYQLNQIGPTNGGVFVASPALLVHTSGQMCWYNAPLLDAFNAAQVEAAGGTFPSTPLQYGAPPSGPNPLWSFVVRPNPPGLTNVFDMTAPFSVDVVVSNLNAAGDEGQIPFDIVAMDESNLVAYGRPTRPALMSRLVLTQAVCKALIPFVRVIPARITMVRWNDAAAFNGVPPETQGTACGQWDPRHPYETSWFNGAEVGLTDYVFDPTGHVWRATGYAEHYVMRDLFSAIVLEPVTAEDAARFRRNVARWCHRHGLTSVQDIMAYRRASSMTEFLACEALSYEHRLSDDPGFFTNRALPATMATGRFNLRVGLYYYLEDADEVDDVINLQSPTLGSDNERFTPPAGHPEEPGWFRWVGWKLQLDGGPGARSGFSNAPFPLVTTNQWCEMTNETSSVVVLADHSFGLLTETDAQPVTFNSRESAALYWLAREWDPASPWYRDPAGTNWIFLCRGVSGWVGRSVATAPLAAALRNLQRQNMTATHEPPYDDALRCADKIRLAVAQVNSAYSNMFASMARVWVHRGLAAAAGKPVPGPIVCHSSSDGAVDLYLTAVRDFREQVTHFPTNLAGLAPPWNSIITSTGILASFRRAFTNERFRVEHMMNVAGDMVTLATDPVTGINAGCGQADHNVAYSLQPSLVALDGQGMRSSLYPREQELWDLPHGTASVWRGMAAVPRIEHVVPCPVFRDIGVPFGLNTDPPANRDPRPALTVIGAVTRCPVELDPKRWTDQVEGSPPSEYPVDYAVGRVYPPIGLDTNTVPPRNPLAMTVEEALVAMTFGGAYLAGLELEQGVLSPPRAGLSTNGWFADLVVWPFNPLAIRGAQGMTLEQIATLPVPTNIPARAEAVNTFIGKFRPGLTLVGGVPVYAGPTAGSAWQGLLDAEP